MSARVRASYRSEAVIPAGDGSTAETVPIASINPVNIALYQACRLRAWSVERLPALPRPGQPSPTIPGRRGQSDAERRTSGRDPRGRGPRTHAERGASLQNDRRHAELRETTRGRRPRTARRPARWPRHSRRPWSKRSAAPVRRARQHSRSRLSQARIRASTERALPEVFGSRRSKITRTNGRRR